MARDLGTAEVPRSLIRLIAREVARELVAESAVADLREVSGAEFARIVGMHPDTAARVLNSGQVPMARRTESGREWRVPIRGIRLWQERREQSNDAGNSAAEAVDASAAVGR